MISNVRPVDQAGYVGSLLGQTSTARVPQYAVQCPRYYRLLGAYHPGDDLQIKIIGFGARFLAGMMPDTKFEIKSEAPEALQFSRSGLHAKVVQCPHVGQTTKVYRFITSSRAVPPTSMIGIQKLTWSTHGIIRSETLLKNGDITLNRCQTIVSEHPGPLPENISIWFINLP